MPLRTKRRSRSFDVPVHDLVLRVTGPEELYEEARAVGMQFWEQVQSYGIDLGSPPAFRSAAIAGPQRPGTRAVDTRIARAQG